MSEPNSPMGTDPNEERELRAVAALLRGLPDPEPPPKLVERVMVQVAEREARPKVIRLLRPFTQPALASAMAAGLGCIALFGAMQGDWLASPGSAEPQPLLPSPARKITAATATDASATRSRRPVVPSFASAAVIDPQLVAYPAMVPAAATTPPSQGVPRPDPAAAADRRLDRQLNHLMLNPQAFYQRFDAMRSSERFASRLAARAARRGDAVEMALSLRQRLPDADRTNWMVERLLRAALVRGVAER